MNFPVCMEELERETEQKELWFADGSRIVQRNKITRRWAGHGTGPVGLRDQRATSAYIFGAVCPGLAWAWVSFCHCATS
jgi:hypothetical protein